MSTTFRPYQPNQLFLLPPSPKDWLREDHLAYFISETVDRLDMSVFYRCYEGDGRRNCPFDPRMMVKVLLYAYCIGVPFSRRIAKRLHEGGMAANLHRSQPDEALWSKEPGISGTRNVSLGLDRAMQCQRVHEKQVRHDQMPSAFDLCPLLNTPCLAKTYFI